MSDSIDMIPFFADSLSYVSRIYDDIDKIYYGENKYEYYRLAKESEYYDCYVSNCHSVLRVYYYRKILGILLFSNNTGNSSDVINLFKKGYRKCYLYFKNNESNHDFHDFMTYYSTTLCKSYMSDEEVYCNLIAGIFFANAIMPFENWANTKDYITLLIEMWDFYILGNRRLNTDKIAPAIFTELREKYPVNKVLEDCLHGSTSQDDNPYAYIYDVENISSSSIFEDVKMTQKDYGDLRYIYNELYKREDRLSFDDFCIAAMQIKACLKAYNLAKKLYFDNNKESMFLELEKRQEEIAESQAQLKKERDALELLKYKTTEEINGLRKDVSFLQKENKRLQEKLDSTESDSKEAIALREYVYSLAEEPMPVENEKIDIEALNKVAGVIIGGHPNWQQKLKDELRGWKFIATDVSLNEEVVSNAEVVLFNVSYIGHPLYNKAMSIIRNNNIRIGYIGSTNIDLCIAEIEKLCK